MSLEKDNLIKMSDKSKDIKFALSLGELFLEMKF